LNEKTISFKIEILWYLNLMCKIIKFQNNNTMRRKKSLSFIFSSICTVLVLIGGGYACVVGILRSNTLSIVVGSVLFLLGIAGLIENKRNRDTAYEYGVSDRIRNSFFRDWFTFMTILEKSAKSWSVFFLWKLF